MRDVLNVARWEWFKLRRRWMPWILIAILLLFGQLVLWGTFFSYRNLKGSGGEVNYGLVGGGPREQAQTVACNDLRAGKVPAALQGVDPSVVQALLKQCELAATRQQERVERLYQHFTLPGSVTNTFQTSLIFGLILLTILTASVVGAEYGYGTLRPILALGTGRTHYLAGKLLVLVASTAGALGLLCLVTLASSLLAKALESPAPLGNLANPTWGEAASAIGRTAFALLPYLVLTALVTVLTRSSASGMAIGLGYFFAEEIASALLATFFDWFNSVQQYLLGHTLTGWASANAFQGADATRPSEVHSLLVLGTYGLLCIAAAFWSFARRDVTGATGS